MQPNSAVFMDSYRKTFGKIQCALEGSPHAVLSFLLWNFWGGRDLKGRHGDCPEAHSVSKETIICSIEDDRELRHLTQAAVHKFLAQCASSRRQGIRSNTGLFSRVGN